MRDRGFVLGLIFSPQLHIDRMCCITLNTLGLIKRTSSEIQQVPPFKVLFRRLVGTILKYDCVLWYSHTDFDCIKTDRASLEEIFSKTHSQFEPLFS